MKLLRFAISLLGLTASLAFGQQELPKTIVGNAVVGRPTKLTMGVRESVAKIMRRQHNTPVRTSPYWKYQEHEGPVKDPAASNPFSPAVSQWPLPATDAKSRTLPGAGPIKPHTGPYFSVGGDFEASTFADENAWPPDTMGDVSPTQVLVCVNGRIRVFDKSGVMGGLNADTDVFFASVLRPNAFTTDPRVRYDRYTGRWFIIMIDALGTNSDVNNRLLIAVSSGSTVTSTSDFTFFQFSIGSPAPTGDTTAFFDYPTLGLDTKALYVGGNCFFNNGSYSTTVFVINKSSLLGAGPVVVSAFRDLMNFTTFVGPDTPQGVDNDDPNSTDGYIIGTDGAAWGTLDIRKISTPDTTPVMGPLVQLTVPDTKFPKNPVPLGSTRSLDALNDRLFAAKMCTNQTTGKHTIWTAHNIGITNAGVATTSPTRTGSRWYEVDVSGASPSLVQSGTLYDSTTNATCYWIPTIVQSPRGEVALGSSSGGPNQRTAISFAERKSGDTAGTLSNLTNVLLSTASYNDASGLSPQRWGDYSHTVVDPADGMTLWTFQMYAKTNTQYAVHFVKLVAAAPAAISTVSPSAAEQGTSVSITVNGTSSNGSGFYEPGSSYAKHIAAAFSGTGITVNSVTVNSPTQVVVNATLASNATEGARSLTITNPDGQTTTLASAFTVNSGSILSITPTTTVGATTPYPVLTVTLPSAAPAGGTVVTLTSSNTAVAKVPATVTVPQGSTTVTTPVTTLVVSADTDVTISGVGGGKNGSVSLHVAAATPKTLTFTPLAGVVGGTSAKFTFKVTLTGKAPAGGLVVNLNSNSTDLPVPASVTVAAGSLVASFTASPNSVATNKPVTVTATANSVTATANCTILAPSVSAVTISPSTVYGDPNVQPVGTVKLNGPAPTGGLDIPITNDQPATVTAPSSVHIDAAQTSNTFNMSAIPVNSHVRATITATYGAAKHAYLDVQPSVISAITLSSKTVVGKVTVVATVKLNAPAGPNGRKVALSTSNAAVAKFASTTVTVPAGQTSATVNVLTFSVDASTAVTLTGTLVQVKTATLTVIPPRLNTLTLSTTSVQGGSSTVVTGTVTIDGPAGPSGRTISLSSSNTSAATVPASVTVPAGATSTTFTVTTLVVPADVQVTISAILDALTRTRNLTVKH